MILFSFILTDFIYNVNLIEMEFRFDPMCSARETALSAKIVQIIKCLLSAILSAKAVSCTFRQI